MIDIDILPVISLLLLSASIAVVLAVFAWKQKKTPGAMSFGWLSLTGALLSIFDALELAAPTLAEKLFWHNFLFISLLMPALFLMFVLQYTDRKAQLFPFVGGLSVLLFALTVLFSITRWPPGWIYFSQPIVDTRHLFPILSFNNGFWVWFSSGFAVVVIMSGCVLLIDRLFSTSELYRLQIGSLLMGILVAPVVVYLVSYRIRLLPPFNVFPLSYAVTNLIISWGLFRYGFLNLAPVARDTFLQNIRDTYLVVDRENRVVDLNRPAQKLFNRSSQQMLGQPAGSLIPEGAQELGAFLSGERTSGEVTFGEPAVIYEVNGISLRSQPGKDSGRLIVLHDITAYKQLEAEIRSSEEKYRIVVEKGNDAIALIQEDRIQYSNPQLSTLLGYTQIELQNLEIERLLAPGNREVVMDRYRRRETGEDVPTRYEAELLKKDGAPVSVELNARLTNINAKPGVLVFIRDISEQKKAEATQRAYQQLQESRGAETEILKRVAETLNQVMPAEQGLVMALQIVAERFEAKAGWLRTLEANGKTIAASYRLPVELDDPETTPSLGMCQCLRQLVLREKAPIDVSIFACEYLLLFRKQLGGQVYHASIPVQASGRPVGMLNLVVDAERQFDEGERRLLSSFGDQFGGAMERMRLFAETQKALRLEQSLNLTAHAINMAYSPQEIIESVVSRSIDLVAGTGGAICIFDQENDQIITAATQNNPLDLATFGKSVPMGRSLCWHVIDTGRPLLVGPDGLSGYLQAEMEEHGIRNLIAVPLPIDFTPGGVLVVISTRQEEVFAPREMVLLQTIAEQAGLAIQKARLYESQGRRARELDALRETMADISSELEVDRLLNKILQRAMDLLSVNEGELNLYVPEEQVLQTVASQNKHGDFKGKVYHIGEGPRGETAATRQPMIRTDERQWETGLHGEDGEPHDLLLVPLLAGSELMGVISMGANRMERRFTQADVRLLELFAQEATIAIRNANLFDQVHTLAITDSLTGLFNRRHFFFLAQSELERALRYQHPLSILMIDIDHFKKINDTFGHTSGDQALLAVAQCCKTWLRQVDLIGRYGGEEIVVLMPETTPDAALQAAERLRAEVETIEVPTFRGIIRVTISVGVADLAEMDGQNLDKVLDRADRALYLAKEGGRNRVSQWDWNNPASETFAL